MNAHVHRSVKAKADPVIYDPPATPPPVELQRHPVGNAGRKHPPYGRELAAEPPPADVPLRVIVGWDHAKIVTEYRVIVLQTDDPETLRFDAAKGRNVRVDHPHDVDASWLLSLAQALIDYGATEVRLTINDRPGAFHTEVLRVVPKGQA